MKSEGLWHRRGPLPEWGSPYLEGYMYVGGRQTENGDYKMLSRQEPKDRSYRMWRALDSLQPGKPKSKLTTYAMKRSIRSCDIYVSIPYALPCNRDLQDPPLEMLVIYYMVIQSFPVLPIPLIYLFIFFMPSPLYVRSWWLCWQLDCVSTSFIWSKGKIIGFLLPC